MRDIVFFLREKYIMALFEGDFDVGETFLTSYVVPSTAKDNLEVKMLRPR